MRKQLPVIQEATNIRSPNSMTYTSDFPTIHKNTFLDVYEEAEERARKIYLVKRPGLNTDSTINPSPVPAGVNPKAVAAAISPTGDGSFFVIYSDSTLAGTTFYWNNALKAKPGTWGYSGALGHNIIQLGTDAALYGGYYFAFTNFAEGALVDNTGTVTEIVDADYTAWGTAGNGTRTNIVASDGYLFQGDYPSGYIYNSDLNAPTSWTATGRIQANLYAGTMVKLIKIRHYLVAFKSTSIEFFENTGQPAPGSPLTSVPALARRYGAAKMDLFAETSDGIVWVGFDAAGRPGIFKLAFDTLAITEISNSFIASLIQTNQFISAPLLAGGPYAWLSNALTLTFRNKELVLFPLQINGNVSLGTFTYDNKLGTWSMWTAQNPLTGGTESAFPTVCSIRVRTGTAVGKLLFSGFDYSFHILEETNFKDFGIYDFEIKWSTDMWDFGTTRRKFMNSLELVVETGSGSGLSPQISMKYYDSEDVSTTAATPRTVLLTSLTNGRVRALWRRLGSFRQRKFVFSMTWAAALRIGAAEVDISMAEDDVG